MLRSPRGIVAWLPLPRRRPVVRVVRDIGQQGGGGPAVPSRTEGRR